MKNYEYPIMVFDGRSLIIWKYCTYKDYIESMCMYLMDHGYYSFIFKGCILTYKKLNEDIYKCTL